MTVSFTNAADFNPKIGQTVTARTEEGEEANVTVEDVDADSIYGIGADGFDYLLRTFPEESHLYQARANDRDWSPVGTITDVDPQ